MMSAGSGSPAEPPTPHMRVICRRRTVSYGYFLEADRPDYYQGAPGRGFLDLSVLSVGMSVEEQFKSVQPEDRAPDPRRDEDLMALLRTGQDEPLGVLMTRHGAELLRFFLLRCRDPHTAQDLANETFYRIFSKARTFEPEKPFRPWFFTVATNVWRGWLRRRRPPEVPLQSLPETAEEPAPSAAASDTDRAARLLEELSEIDREILVLRHYEGLNLKEIAQRLGLRPGAVYTRLFRALEKLRGLGSNSDPV